MRSIRGFDVVRAKIVHARVMPLTAVCLGAASIAPQQVWQFTVRWPLTKSFVFCPSLWTLLFKRNQFADD